MESKSACFNKNYSTISTEDYPVDIRYGEKDWTMVSALRELFANMLDTKAPYVFAWDKGVGVIVDKGAGIPKQAFVIGNSSKSSDNTSIGQYGEGLKMALITCLRYDRHISISTVGYGVSVTKICREFNDANKIELMRVIYNNNANKEGTKICIECTKEEWDVSIELFLQFKKGYQKLDNNLFLPGGFVCVLGLRTDEKPGMVFSYDLSDKSITNRDRNTVKTKTLKENMEKILNNLKNQKAIKMYFEALENNPEAEEFKITLKPKYNDKWLSAISKVYGDKVVYGSTIENDVKATAQGYKVIRNISKTVAKTLSDLGLQSSKEVSKGVKNDIGIIEKDKITYPISKNYCESWDYLDAGREFLANALDTSKEVIVDFCDGYCIIKDNGIGIQRKDFVIGNSQKTESEIGMFGEGFKVASLVMAREERDLTITTVGFTYIPMLEDSEEFGTELFTVKFKPNSKTEGTLVTFKATEEEVENIKNLFLNFKKNLRVLKTRDIDLIFESEGNIYANGLKSASMNTLFSYNVHDKKVVNTRDRNNVNEEKLNSYVTAFINGLKDESAIELLLTEWKSDIYKYEYKLILNPIDITPWQDVCKKIFSNSCIMGYNMEENFIAKQAGYELLNNIPAYIKTILERTGVSSAADVANKYRDKGILLGNRIVYPIFSGYGSNWTIQDAIREIISNALDTDTDIDISVENNRAFIKDKGTGLKRKNLLFGVTKKTNSDTTIGSFGEGLKMAALVFARSKRDFKVSTVGFDFIVKLEKDKEFEADVLVLYIKSNERTEGTTVSFKSSASEIESAKNLFLRFNDTFVELENGIFKPAGKIFINGACVTNINSLFSYNLTGEDAKLLLERDRKNIDSYGTKFKVSALIGNTKSEEVIETILRLNDTQLFENLSNLICINGQKKRKWRNVANNIYEKCCLPVENSEINLVAKDEGYKVLTNLNNTVAYILKNIKFPFANEVVKLRGDEDFARRVVNPDGLNETGKTRWNSLISVISKEYGEDVANHLVICEEFVNPDEGVTLGKYSPIYDKCYLLRELVESESNYNLSELIGTAAHEICHRDSKAYDRTREFENCLTNIIGDLLVRLHQIE